MVCFRAHRFTYLTGTDLPALEAAATANGLTIEALANRSFEDYVQMKQLRAMPKRRSAIQAHIVRSWYLVLEMLSPFVDGHRRVQPRNSIRSSAARALSD